MNYDDLLTKLSRFAALALSAGHPVLFGICFMGGIATKGVFFIIEPSYPHLAWLRAAAALNGFYYVAFYIFAIFGLKYFWRGPALSEQAITHLKTLEILIDKASSSAADRRQAWRDILQRYLEKAKPDLDNPVSNPETVRKPSAE